MVICSLVSPSYDPHLAIWWLIHDVVMIAGCNIVTSRARYCNAHVCLCVCLSVFWQNFKV